MKKQIVKGEMNFKSIRAERDFLIKNKFNFKLLVSNYTVEINSPQMETLNKKYVSKMQGKKAFAAYKKILFDLQNWSANENPNVKPYEVEYFSFNWHWGAVIENRPEGQNFEEVFDCYSVDINSAYATVLFRDGFICKDTFDYIMGLDKEERLVCVGMLASRKDVFTYSGGELISYDEIRSETEGYFFYCVQRVQFAMSQCEHIVGYYHICNWVDCIYFYHSEYVQQIQDYLNSVGFNSKSERIDKILIESKEDVFYIEQHKGDKKKFLNIPKTHSKLRKNKLKELNLI